MRPIESSTCFSAPMCFREHDTSPSAHRLCFSRRLRIRIGQRGLMPLFLAHGIECAPVGLQRSLGTKHISRDTSFFMRLAIFGRFHLASDTLLMKEGGARAALFDSTTIAAYSAAIRTS